MKKEPVLTIGVVAGVLVALASKLHVVLDADTVTTVLVSLVPVLSALVGRAHVSPAKQK